MTPTIVDVMARGARGFRGGVTFDGSENFVGRARRAMEAGRGIELVGDQHATYEHLYKTQVWVHVVTNRLARSIGRLPLKVYVNPDEPDARERVRDGALADLLRYPGGTGDNRLRRLGPGRLKQEIVSNVAIHGNCVLVKSRERAGRPVTQLIPSSFAYWKVTKDANGNTWYTFSPGNGPTVPFRPDEVLHFSWWAPGNGLEAPSPLQALRTTLMAEDATQRHVIASFENGQRPAGAFSIEGEVKNPDVITRMREQLHQIYGGVDNAFKLAILEGGAKWLSMQHTLVESDVLNLRKLDREEVAAVYNLPPPVIGILERATFSNITEQHLMEYQDSVQPWTSMIEEVFALQLILDEPLMEGQYAEFDFNAVLAGDPVKRIEVVTKAVGGPFMTPNEARATQNLPPLDEPEADKLRPAPNASLKGDSSGRGNESQTDEDDS